MSDNYFYRNRDQTYFPSAKSLSKGAIEKYVKDLNEGIMKCKGNDKENLTSVKEQFKKINKVIIDVDCISFCFNDANYNAWAHSRTLGAF